VNQGNQMSETKQSTDEKMPILNLSTGTAPEPTTIEGYKHLTKSLRQEIEILKKELNEVRSTMLMRMVHDKAKRHQIGLKSGVRLQSLVDKVKNDEDAHNKLSEHELSQKKREAEIIARREAAHNRLMRRREKSQPRTNGKKTKKTPKTSVHPEVVQERLGTGAVDVEDFIVNFSHGPLGLHLEEIHDCSFSAFVAETQNNSQAKRAGLEVGDILIKIKGKSMEDIPFDDTIQTLMASGRPLKLTFRRRIKVYCDHTEGLDGCGHMHGHIFSFDATHGDLGFALEEMSNATLNGVRYDLCVTDVVLDGPASQKGLKSLDVLVGINGDSVGGLGFEETCLLLVKSPRPMSLHFFRFSKENDTIEMGTDYLHEEVIFILQYVDLALSRKFNNSIVNISKKDEINLKKIQVATHELNTIKASLRSLLDEGALHSDRQTCVQVLKNLRSCLASLDEAQMAVNFVGQKNGNSDKKSKKKN
jgi:hypothetical protein